jgi:aminomethyltransferase
VFGLEPVRFVAETPVAIYMLKRTPLYAAHQKLGGKLIEFGGWEMPVQYTSIVDEHLVVRRAAGIFDICHMGEVVVCGSAATDFLIATLTNDVRKLAAGQGQYTLMCNERGGVIDDLYVYHVCDALEGPAYVLILNASRIEADMAWLEKQRAAFPEPAGVDLCNNSDLAGAVAVQGPKVREFIDQLVSGLAVFGSTQPKVTCVGPAHFSPQVAKPSELKKNQIAMYAFAGGKAATPAPLPGTSEAECPYVWVACTGYTGEDGFEVFASAEMIETVWNALLAAGTTYGLKPCGLGARDTLRTEVCYPLYGHELDEDTTPIEAGVSFAVALDKEFIGRPRLAEQKAGGTAKRCVAFKMTDKSAPPRPHYAIWSVGPEARLIGEVTSGTQSPSLGVGIGLGYVPKAFAKSETRIEIEIRGRRCPAVVVPKPIYRKGLGSG